MSRREICHIRFRGRHISPSFSYREAWSFAEISDSVQLRPKAMERASYPGLSSLLVLTYPAKLSGGTALFSDCSNSASAL